MKKNQVISIYRLMSNIKVSRIKNKEIRKAIIKNHLMLYKITKEHDDDINELHKRLFEGKEDEQKELAVLREKFSSETNEENKLEIINKIKTDFKDLILLEVEFSEEAQRLLNEDVDISLVKMDQDEFIDAAVDAEVDITNSDLIILQEMFNN